MAFYNQPHPKHSQAPAASQSKAKTRPNSLGFSPWWIPKLGQVCKALGAWVWLWENVMFQSKHWVVQQGSAVTLTAILKGWIPCEILAGEMTSLRTSCILQSPESFWSTSASLVVLVKKEAGWAAPALSNASWRQDPKLPKGFYETLVQ